MTENKEKHDTLLATLKTKLLDVLAQPVDNPEDTMANQALALDIIFRKLVEKANDSKDYDEYYRYAFTAQNQYRTTIRALEKRAKIMPIAPVRKIPHLPLHD